MDRCEVVSDASYDGCTCPQIINIVVGNELLRDKTYLKFHRLRLQRHSKSVELFTTQIRRLAEVLVLKYDSNQIDCQS